MTKKIKEDKKSISLKPKENKNNKNNAAFNIFSETIKEIIKNYLVKYGYNGLFNADIGCGCVIEDICLDDSNRILGCEPAYKVVCDRERCPRVNDDEIGCGGETGGNCFTTIKPKENKNEHRKD